MQRKNTLFFLQGFNLTLQRIRKYNHARITFQIFVLRETITIFICPYALDEHWESFDLMKHRLQYFNNFLFAKIHNVTKHEYVSKNLQWSIYFHYYQPPLNSFHRHILEPRRFFLITKWEAKTIMKLNETFQKHFVLRPLNDNN